MNRDDYLKTLKSNVERWEQQEGLDPTWPRDALVQSACRAFLTDFICSDSLNVLEFYQNDQFVEFGKYLGRLNSFSQGMVRDYVLHFVSAIQVKI